VFFASENIPNSKDLFMKLFRLNLSAMVATVVVTACLPAFAGTQTGSLPQLAAGQSLGRALGIPTVPNLRDVGGYKTQEGATVVRGLVYRSDTFNPMSAEDKKKLGRLNLKNNYDLRTHSEVRVKPDQMPSAVQYHQLNVLADAKSASPAETFRGHICKEDAKEISGHLSANDMNLFFSGSIMAPRAGADNASALNKGARALSSLVVDPLGLLAPFLHLGADKDHPFEVSSIESSVL
jgi:hypothetical protein